MEMLILGVTEYEIIPMGELVTKFQDPLFH